MSVKGYNLDYKKRYQEKAQMCKHMEKEILILKKDQLENEKRYVDIK